MNFSSKLIEEAVNEFSGLPGIGKKTALRLALHLLKREPHEVERFSAALSNMRNKICYCKMCYNISDSETCEICANPSRNGNVICVVENLRDVIAIENTHQFKGLYHVLGGVISPMDGIGPKDLNMEELIERVKEQEVNEVIMALSPTVEGDTTNFYLYKRLREFDIMVSTIARGIAIGDELEYADEVTLGRSLLNRIPFENSMQLK